MDTDAVQSNTDDHSMSNSGILSWGNFRDHDNLMNSGKTDISTIYVLGKAKQTGKVWPLSQFEKIDVLEYCLHPKRHHEEDDRIHSEYRQHLESAESMALPLEILMRIFEILYLQGELRPDYLCISKLIHALLLPMLYRRPRLKATNFFSFVDALVSNKSVGSNVKELDLSYIIQTGKNAFVAKLLKRCGSSLKLFVAPQTSFGFAPLIALKNCINLNVLDLRLVSETLDLDELFNSLKNLPKLTQLSFPRSSIELKDINGVYWPSSLKFLRLSGGINDAFLLNVKLPPTITELEFTHCPQITDDGFYNVLHRLGKSLRVLRVHYPMPGLTDGSLDAVFQLCPNLISLSVAVDYVSDSFFDEANLNYLSYERPLKILHIDSSGMLGTSTRLDPVDLAIALDDERLPFVKRIWCTAKLGWDPNSEYVTYIVDTLEERGGGLYIGY